MCTVKYCNGGLSLGVDRKGCAEADTIARVSGIRLYASLSSLFTASLLSVHRDIPYSPPFTIYALFTGVGNTQYDAHVTRSTSCS